jgi:tRNA A-37 threonylcarbamoyl transferase component Bud32
LPFRIALKKPSKPAGDYVTIDITELNELRQQIVEVACHTAGSAHVTAVGLIDTYPTHTENGKSVLEAVVVIKDFQPRLLSYFRTINGRNVFFFAVDQWVFERDIDRGFLGEAIASKLIFPYISLQGDCYLHGQELLLKKRLILESIANLSIGYPELVYHMQIKPQFFLYDVLLKRVRVFPLLAYEMTNMLEGSTLKDEEKALKSYNDALMQLAVDGLISRVNGYVTVSKEFALQSRNPKVWLTNLSKNAPRTLFTSFFGVFPQLLNIIAQDTQAFIRTQKINLHLLQTDINPNCYTIDPQKYVFVPTSEGLVSLADKVNISGFTKKMFINEKPESVTFEAIGGVLNDIYLIKAQVNGVERKVLVKRFKDWSGFKWFPLTLWSFGARAFAVSGKARLAKECATSEFLRLRGFNVPKILFVSNPERLVFMDFIEGEDLSHSIKRLALDQKNKDSIELVNIEVTGELFAKVHSHGMTLGDTKPENVMIGKDGTVYLLDFEQATQDGDKAWDIAEFLYYSGHYLQPLQNNQTAEDITKAFIKGYLHGGGDLKDVKKAESAKYTRVFSVFTMPSTILAIANTIRKA